MRNVCLLFLIFLSLYSHAQFAAAYSPSNWTTALSPSSNGTVNTSGAPASILITGSDGPNASNVNTDYSITALTSGVWSFNWSYHTNDSDNDPQYDPAGVLINGVFTQLTSNAGGTDQSGNFSQAVTAGSIIGFRVRAVDNIFGNATFTISSFVPPGGVLPVKLLQFNARQQDGLVLLNWTTDSEKNFSHFVVERSTNAINFSTLQSIASGSSSGQYSYIDKTPAGGPNYYRLRMVDHDGTFTHSSIAEVRLTSSLRFKIFPNPASDYLYINMQTETSGNEILTIYNATGVAVKMQSLTLQQGANNRQLNIASLPKGTYFVLFKRSGLMQSFIRQ